MIVDYYWVKRQRLKVAYLYSNDPREACHHSKGWNRTALIAFAIGLVFSVAAVWVTALCDLPGCAWLLGALLGGVIYRVLTPKAV